MSMEIGQVIFQMRKNHNLTQEQLANSINVSPQAISKWETGVSYPDITMLPVIAEFFNVTIDYLLRFNLNEQTENGDDLINQLKQLNYNGKYEEALSIAKQHYKLSLNYKIEYQKGEAIKGLAMINRDVAKKTILLCDARSIYEFIIKNCNDSILINKAKLALATVFNHLEKYDEAIDTAKSIGSNVDINGILSFAYKRKGDYAACKKLLQEHLLNSIDGIYKSCFALCSLHNDMNEYERSLEFSDLLHEFLNTANKSGKTNYWSRSMLMYYYFRVSTLIKADKTEEAISELSEYVEYVSNLDKEVLDEIYSVCLISWTHVD